MATEAAGSNARNRQEGKKKTLLTHTDLLMQGAGVATVGYVLLQQLQ
jgi:hypothetical protein